MDIRDVLGDAGCPDTADFWNLSQAILGVDASLADNGVEGYKMMLAKHADVTSVEYAAIKRCERFVEAQVAPLGAVPV